MLVVNSSAPRIQNLWDRSGKFFGQPPFQNGDNVVNLPLGQRPSLGNVVPFRQAFPAAGRGSMLGNEDGMILHRYHAYSIVARASCPCSPVLCLLNYAGVPTTAMQTTLSSSPSMPRIALTSSSNKAPISQLPRPRPTAARARFSAICPASR